MSPLSLSLSVCLPVCRCLCFCLCLSVCLSVSISVSLCVSLSVSVSDSLSLSLSVCLPISLSLCLCLSLSVCLCLCLSPPLPPPLSPSPSRPTPSSLHPVYRKVRIYDRTHPAEHFGGEEVDLVLSNRENLICPNVAFRSCNDKNYLFIDKEKDQIYISSPECPQRTKSFLPFELLLLFS